MKKRYYWNDEFSNKSFDKFIKFQNDLNQDDELELWLNSNGGQCVVGEMLRALIESYDINKFQLIGAGRLYSSALDLFVTANCKKYLIPGTVGLVHTSSQWVEVNDAKEFKLKYSEEKLMINTCPMVKQLETMLPNVLSPEEMRKYYQNEDVYLTTDEIKKFLT